MMIRGGDGGGAGTTIGGGDVSPGSGGGVAVAMGARVGEVGSADDDPPTWAVKARTKGVIGSGNKMGPGDGGMEPEAPNKTQ